MPSTFFLEPSDSNPEELTIFADRLWFVAGDGLHGRELWVSDGTPEGTRLLDLRADGDSLPHQLTHSVSRLYFSAFTVEFGRELWSSDGSVEGTRLVADIDPGSNTGVRFNQSMLAHGGRVYFEGRGGLWMTNDSAEGAVRLDLTPVGAPDLPRLVGFAGERLVFHTSFPDYFLWATEDGASFERLGDLRDGDAPLEVGGELFLRAKNDARGRELWRTDGTFGGTPTRLRWRRWRMVVVRSTDCI